MKKYDNKQGLKRRVDMKDIGQRIREHREKKELSITELADRIGVSRSYLSRMETGERPIKTEILASISDTLGVPIEDFYHKNHKKSINLEGEEVIVIDKNRHHLNKYTDEEILEFIKVGQKIAKSSDE